MHKVYFYRDRRGRIDIKEYIDSLLANPSKENRIRLNKVRTYMQMLRDHGTKAGEPYVKHLGGELWELRPQRDRVIFVGWLDGSYVLLHHFIKKTQKTPMREIEQAKRELADLKERGDIYGN